MKNNETVIIAQCIHFISKYSLLNIKMYSYENVIWKCIHVKMNSCSTMNFEFKRSKMCAIWYSAFHVSNCTMHIIYYFILYRVDSKLKVKILYLLLVY